MRRFFIAFAVLIGGGASASAAPVASWNIDKAHSQIAFVASMSGQAINGRFGRYDASILFDKTRLADSKVSVTIETGSAATGDQTRDESLPTPDWFNVKVFPTASFTANGFRDLGKGDYQAPGMLTIRGVHHAVNLPFHLTFTGDAVAMRGAVAIDRRWFGVGQGQFASPDTVASNVTINIAVAAVRAK